MSGGRSLQLLARLAKALQLLETALIVGLLAALVLFASAQIVLRNVFSIGLTWADGAIRMSVFWLALLGALAASRDGRHITMGALTQWLPARLKKAAGLTADVAAAGVSGALAYFSFEFVRDSREYGDVLLNDLPAWPLQAVMPVVFALIAYRYAFRALDRARGS